MAVSLTIYEILSGKE